MTIPITSDGRNPLTVGTGAGQSSPRLAPAPFQHSATERFLNEDRRQLTDAESLIFHSADLTQEAQRNHG